DGATVSFVIDTVLQPLQLERIAIAAIISLSRQIKPGAALVRGGFVGEGCYHLFPGIAAMRYPGMMEDFIVLQINYEQAFFGAGETEVHNREYAIIDQLSLCF